MTSYLRLNEGLTNYKLIPADDDIWEYVKDVHKDYYVSIFKYNDEHYKKWKETKSLSGIQDVQTNKLVFDFDSKNDINLAKEDAKKLISRLISKGIDPKNIQVTFSGNKGFGVELTTTTSFTPEEFKNTVYSLAGDLDTFDKKIHDPQRIIRLVGTKHQQSGLFKIPLSVNELAELDINHIKRKAIINEYDEFTLSGWIPVDLPNNIVALKNAIPKESVKPKGQTPEELDVSLRPKWLTEAKYALQEGFFEEGERNEACMILASTYKNQGISSKIAYNMLVATLELREERFGYTFNEKSIQKEIIDIVYSNKWNGGQYSYEKTPLLQEVTRRLGLKPPKSEEKPLEPLNNISNIFKRFATEIDSNTIKLGIDKIDQEVRITTSMLVGLVSPAGGGKTTTSFEIMKHASLNNIKTVFFSMDMGAPLVYQRLIQKHTGFSSKKIFSLYQNGSNEIEKFDKLLEETYKNVSFCFKSGLTVEEIRELTIQKNEETGEKTKLIVIDYLECISSQFSDATASSAYITQKLKDLANELECTVLLLLQPQKIAGDPSDEINSYTRIKGSSVIQQACSVIFSMNRPGFSPKDPGKDRFISFYVLKNRMGALGQFDFYWNGLTGEIRELDECEIEELEQIRKNKEEEKKNNGL